MRSHEMLGKLIDEMTSDSYSPPGTVTRDGVSGFASVPPKHTYIDGDPKIFDKRTHADLHNLDEDIWRLIDCYNTRRYYAGRRPWRCRHKWLKFCPRCGERHVGEKGDHG